MRRSVRNLMPNPYNMMSKRNRLKLLAHCVATIGSKKPERQSPR